MKVSQNTLWILRRFHTNSQFTSIQERGFEQRAYY